MKKVLLILVTLFVFKSYSQEKPMRFYDINGKKITRDKFYKNKDFSKNLDLHFENDSIQYGFLIKRINFGKLNKAQFGVLKKYINELSNTKIDSTKNIVINYLSSHSKKSKKSKRRTSWNIFDNDYLRKLHKIAEIQQFWINSPGNDNLEYFHSNTINFISDKDKLFEKLFFPYQIPYGNYLIIKPNGLYVTSAGKYGKQHVWKLTKKFIK